MSAMLANRQFYEIYCQFANIAKILLTGIAEKILLTRKIKTQNEFELREENKIF